MAIHTIDLHFHAGRERTPDASLQDYLNYALYSGRKIVGITDHLELYTHDNPDDYRQSSRDISGLMNFYKNVQELKIAFPSLTLLFSPEIHSPHDPNDLEQEILDLADYLICGMLNHGKSFSEKTDNLLAYISLIRKCIDRTGKPAFLAHPFRINVVERLTDPSPWALDVKVRPNLDYSEKELNEFFRCDIRAVARHCAALDIAVEISGGTYERILNANHPAPLLMLWSAFRLLKEENVSLVPGSDLHSIQTGRIRNTVPWEGFSALDIGVENIGFLKKIGISPDFY